MFNHTFDYDEWPAIDTDTRKSLNPYNQSMFKLRFAYMSTFPLQWQQQSDLDVAVESGRVDPEHLKVFKINYQLNILTSMSEEHGSLMDALSNSKELEIFTSDVVKDLIDFKWVSFSRWQHQIGFFFHTVYVVGLAIYINYVYIRTYQREQLEE